MAAETSPGMGTTQTKLIRSPFLRFFLIGSSGGRAIFLLHGARGCEHSPLPQIIGNCAEGENETHPGREVAERQDLDKSGGPGFSVLSVSDFFLRSEQRPSKTSLILLKLAVIKCLIICK